MNKEIAAKCVKLLSSSYVLLVKVQGFHWNITGERFLFLHKHFGDIYESLQDQNDVIAEHCRALGYKPKATMAAFLQNSEIGEQGDPLSCDEMISELASDFETLKSLTDDLATEDDAATVDLAGELSRSYAKTIWMLKSSLEEDSEEESEDYTFSE